MQKRRKIQEEIQNTHHKKNLLKVWIWWIFPTSVCSWPLEIGWEPPNPKPPPTNWRFAMIASFCTASCAKYLRQFSCPSGPDRPNPSWGSGGEIIIDSKGSHFFMGYVLISQEGMFMSHPELKTTEIISGPAMFNSPAQKGTNTFKSRCLTWFRYRVSIHHPFRVLIGTPTWRCWDMLSCKPCARVSKN